MRFIRTVRNKEASSNVNSGAYRAIMRVLNFIGMVARVLSQANERSQLPGKRPSLPRDNNPPWTLPAADDPPLASLVRWESTDSDPLRILFTSIGSRNL